MIINFTVLDVPYAAAGRRLHRSYIAPGNALLPQIVPVIVAL